MKNEKGITTTNASQKVLVESNHNSNKILVDKRSEFYKRSVTSRLQDNDIEIYSRPYERKHVAAETLIRTLKIKIYKYMTSVSKMCILLINIANKYNDTYHSTIRMKPAHVKSRRYTDFNKEKIKEDPKLEFGNHVRISKYQNIFGKGYVPNWFKEPFVIKVKTLCCGNEEVILILKKLLERFTKKNYKN